MRIVYELPKNLAVSIHKRISLFFKKQGDKSHIWWNKESVKNYRSNVTMIVVYGVLSYLAVFSWLNFGSLNPINILGYGSTLYLLMDLYKFYRETKLGGT
jgi:hypothetical protein